MNWEKIKQFFVRLYEKAFDEDIFSSAAQVAFYFLFALFPLLLFLVSIFGIVLESSDNIRKELFGYLQQVMPASAYDLVFKTLDEVVQGSSGGKITLGLFATLYSASAGIDSLRIALNAVYKLKETRSWWKRKAWSVGLTLVFGILIFLALGIIFYGSELVNLIFGKIGVPISSPFLLKTLAVIIVLIALVAVFDVLYYFVPDHKNLAWKWITPGAILAISLWLLFSKAFSVYLSYFDSYAKTYGSLGAIIVLMLWLYLTALVILVGGSMNAILDEFSRGQYTKRVEAPASDEKNSDANNAKEAVDDKTGAPENPNESDSKATPVVSNVEAPPEKTTGKMIVGGIIAGIISIFSFKNKR